MGQSRRLFVTLNVPGGSNNDADIWYGAPTHEHRRRSRISRSGPAPICAGSTRRSRWRKRDSANGVVIIEQADMWDLDGKTAAATWRKYEPFIDEHRRSSRDFGKPVLLINGDSHVYRSDNPLVKGSTCYTETDAAARRPPISLRAMPCDTHPNLSNLERPELPPRRQSTGAPSRSSISASDGER